MSVIWKDEEDEGLALRSGRRRAQKETRSRAVCCRPSRQRECSTGGSACPEELTIHMDEIDKGWEERRIIIPILRRGNGGRESLGVSTQWANERYGGVISKAH